MSENETASASLAPSASEGDCTQCAALRTQLNLVLVAVIVLTTTFALFVWRQTRYYRQDLRAMTPAASAIIQSYNQEKPVVDAFVSKIAEYARSHPDFEPIARKYQLHLATNLPPTAAPAPKQ